MKTCPTCQKSFKKYGRTFCSRVCYDKSRNQKIDLVCKFCNKSFSLRPSDISKSKNKRRTFCSMKCFKEWCKTSPGKEIVICEICSKEFTSKLSRKSKFCSRKCKQIAFDSFKGSDVNNQNFRKGQGVYRKRAFAFYPHECFICKENTRKLYVHHIDESHENNELENLRILCASCHVMVHNGSLALDES